jgi:hypothetical protein
MRIAKLWIPLCLSFLLPVLGATQTIPSKISSVLNDKQKGWTLIDNKCGEKRSVFTADFNRDGKDDYVIQFLATNEKGKRIISQIAFYSSKSDYVEDPLFEEDYEGDGAKLAFEILPVGTDLKLDPPYDLTVGGARVYVCDSDRFYIFRIEKGRLGGGYNRYYVIN